MSFERFWVQQGPVAFTADGGANGVVTVNDVLCFKTKQMVVISSDTQPDLVLQIKRVLSFTQLIVGPKRSKQKTGNTENNLNLREDVSAYTTADNAMIKAPYQPKTKIPPNDIVQATFEHEPTNAVRTIGVDKVGMPWGAINPFPVTNINPGDIKTPIIYLESGTITDITETLVATFTATIANSNINRLLGEAHTFGEWRIYKTSISIANLRAVKRTSFSERTADLLLEQPEVLASIGDKLLITFRAQRYRTALLGSPSATFVRLEGYY